MWASPPPAPAGDDAPWHRSRRIGRGPGEDGHSNGATAKAPMNALAAASAKQAAIPTTMFKSMAMPGLPALPSPPVAPWHKTTPLPAPPVAPWRTSALPAPPKASAAAPWQALAARTAPAVSSSAPSDGLPGFVDRVAGILQSKDALSLAEYRSRLVTIYSAHNPSNVPKIDYLLGKYKGQEQLLYESVCNKYQVPSTWDGRLPLPSAATNAVPTGSSAALPSLSAVQASETQHKDQAAQPSLVNGGAKLDAAISPPWARKEATPLLQADLSKSESKGTKRAAPSKTEEADDDLFEVSSEAALAALQSLTQDMGEPKRLPKKLKPAPEIPSSKGMARIDYFLVGEKTGFFSDEETVEDLFDAFSDVDSDEEELKAKQQAAEKQQQKEESEEKTPQTAEPVAEPPKSPEEAEEKLKKDEEKAEEEKQEAKELEDVDQEEEREKSPILAEPVMPPETSELQKEELRREEERKRRTRRPPTPPKAPPRRKLPQPKAEAAAAPAASEPQRPPAPAEEDDDDEVVVLSVSAGDQILNRDRDKESETRKKKEKQDKERKEQEAKERKEQEAKERKEQEAKERKEQEAIERKEQEAKERKEQEVKERKEQEAKEQDAKKMEDATAEERDPGIELEDAKLGEQMRAALGSALARQFSSNPRLPAADRQASAPPEERSDDVKKRLAAAAAAARGIAAKAAEASDSESDSESYSQSSDEEDEPDANQGAASNGVAHPKGDRSVRDSLLGEIFQDLQDFSGTPGRATMKAMQRFVTMVGFDGSDNEWRTEYLSLCKEWQMDPETGFNQEAFAKMCNDTSEKGCYCNDEELKIILNKLITAPKRVEPKKRKQPAPESPEKRQKVEIAFQ